jgi:hypothetical protein
MSTFEFRHSDPEKGPVIARIEAENEREARAFLRTRIHARKMSAREIIELSRRDQAIFDAKTGEVIGAGSDDNQAERQLGDEA